jgi:hypothetical protein
MKIESAYVAQTLRIIRHLDLEPKSKEKPKGRLYNLAI